MLILNYSMIPPASTSQEMERKREREGDRERWLSHDDEQRWERGQRRGSEQ